ncbi:MAG: radical SAM protein [Syntrophobacteraceae bacterium]|jgi:radical SAM protein with 4Fe4S-binding SPASM domain
MTQPLLREFKFELTHRCLLSCRHCSSSAGTDELITVSREDCLRVIAEAAEMGAKEVAFSGGEPLLVPFLAEAVEKASHVDLKVAVYSSGNVPQVKEKIRSLRRAGVDRLIFSMHGASAERYESVTRVNGSFESLIYAMICAGDEEISTEVHFVPLAINYRELSAVAELARRVGATCTSVLRFVPHGRGKADIHNRLNPVQNVELREAILRLRAAGYRIRTGSPYSFMGLSDRPTCGAGLDRLVVRPDLAIVPCDAFKNLDAKDLVGTDEFSRLNGWSLDECWRFSPYLKLLRTTKRDTQKGSCSNCKILPKCGAGCPAQKFLIFGKLTGVPDPDCQMSYSGNDACGK